MQELAGCRLPKWRLTVGEVQSYLLGAAHYPKIVAEKTSTVHRTAVHEAPSRRSERRRSANGRGALGRHFVCVQPFLMRTYVRGHGALGPVRRPLGASKLLGFSFFVSSKTMIAKSYQKSKKCQYKAQKTVDKKISDE